MSPQAKRLIPLALLLLWTLAAYGGASPAITAPPFESDQLRVLIVHDSNNTTPEFAQVLSEVQAAYDCGCLRAVDADAGLEFLPSYQGARAAVNGKQLPWVVGANGDKGFSAPCPQDAEGIYRLVNGIQDAP